MFRLALGWLAGLGIAIAPIAVAAQDFPSKPVKIVVGFGPGGLGDVTTRLVAQKLSGLMGQGFVIENMPGAGGITAAASVAKAPADGYTMLLISGQNATQPLVFKSLPFDPSADFRTVSTISTFDFIIVAANNSPVKSIADVVARAKAEPGKFNFGTISAGSLQHLMAVLFSARAGLSVPTVPFRTTADLTSALLAGEVQAAVETIPGVLGLVQSGQLRALALSGPARRALLPDVPTVVEAGVPDYVVTSWNGFVVPAKVPDAIVARLNAEIAKALAQPDLKKRFAELGLEASPSTAEQMRKVYDEDVERWRGVIAAAGLKLQQ